MRLLVIALLRAGKIEATSKGQVIESALSLEASTTFTNNNLFRQATFRPRTTDCEFTDYVEAGEAYKTCFGSEIQEYEENVIAQAIRETTEAHEETLREVAAQLDKHALPGGEVIATALSNIVGFRRQRDCQALKAFTACHQELKDAIKRGAELANALTEPALHDIARARKALDSLWPFLQQEPDLTDDDREHASEARGPDGQGVLLPRACGHRPAHQGAGDRLPGPSATGPRRAVPRPTRSPWNNSTAPPAGGRSPRSSATASPSRWPPTPSPRRQTTRSPSSAPTSTPVRCAGTRPSRSCCA